MMPVLVALLVSLFTGNEQRPANQPESAQLILYREKEFISGLGKAYTFKINEQKQGKLSPNRFVQVTIPVGRIKVEFDNDYFTHSRPLWLSVQAGQTYYVKAAVEVDFLSSMMVMAPVDPQQARQELRRMKPEQPD
ncbi:hypothetical protein EXU85_16345 [Spirosoma sp. KCTC 42546]|uniref:DUF2846 domain-containing protein n=1 Tax=Spirosoma sp. KCTC 42546 TaxID=2520506 RepID=UPI00115A9BD4|nr:DUF2846 domain-containing protein [Spirosoma sp. KCTC 42546]QDK80091.1 hypothetical protein EXU85_16345 [Spirosoma sp. KCTC 42546]